MVRVHPSPPNFEWLESPASAGRSQVRVLYCPPYQFCNSQFSIQIKGGEVRKIMAVYCRVELVAEPNWLKGFREKYDEPFEFHLTLKQSVYIDQDQLSDVKSRVCSVFKGSSVPSHVIKVTFDELVLDQHDQRDGLGWVYLFSKSGSEVLNDLQVRIRNALQAFDDYVYTESKEYEENFKPHITIARGLNNKSFDEAIRVLGEDYRCEGMIKQIILSCVEKITVDESLKKENLTVLESGREGGSPDQVGGRL